MISKTYSKAWLWLESNSDKFFITNKRGKWWLVEIHPSLRVYVRGFAEGAIAYEAPVAVSVKLIWPPGFVSRKPHSSGCEHAAGWLFGR